MSNLHSQRSPYHPAGHSKCLLGGILTFTEIPYHPAGHSKCSPGGILTFKVFSRRDTYIHRDPHTILRDIHSVHREGCCDDTFLHSDIHRLFHSTQPQLQSLIGIMVHSHLRFITRLRFKNGLCTQFYNCNS